MHDLHTTDMSGRCFKCGEKVGTNLRGCKAPPYKSPREIELEIENAKLREVASRLIAAHRMREREAADEAFTELSALLSV